MGAASSLLDYGQALPEAVDSDLLVYVSDEAERLDSMVRDLLAMTGVEARALEVIKDRLNVGEFVDRAIALAKRRSATQP